jgi:shikimate dehydrogenase
MHNAALRELGLAPRWRYQLLPLAPELFSETVPALPRAGFRGINVTIPHKEAALALADTATPRARAIGAANTLLFAPDGSIEADNTDARALIDALPFEPAGRTALVLGAGGSARAAVWALLDAGAARVMVWNRTSERARALCEELGATPVADPDRAADLLINCTSVGLLERTSSLNIYPMDADAITRYLCVIDFVYTPAGTPLIGAARDRGIPAVDGIELLAGQGALAFERFTGRAAPFATMLAAARGS